MSAGGRLIAARVLVGVGAGNLGAATASGGAWWWLALALIAMFAGDALLLGTIAPSESAA
ncbi:hypothetical protein [Rhodococcoides fascians]|uniref:hypothetical protein n=1 Tax=Rhodococcoides fascians TaxID=1828 RepID=UPI00055DCEA8|nr:hypothetical protein [Rhodococcus fascians]